jgi:hypothetical protein
VYPIEAVQMIREELPGALQPDEAEKATWPAVPASGAAHVLKAATDMELQRAASKLTSLPPDKALAAQTMIRTLAARKGL